MDPQFFEMGVTTSLQLASMDQLAVLMRQAASKFTQGDPRHLIQARPLVLCTVCYNLDLNETPPGGAFIGFERNENAWARYEYNLPPGALVGKIDIRDSSKLIAAAQRGCLICAMISRSISSFSPGWDKQISYIHLFLASNLPLVVRLRFGGVSRRMVGPEVLHAEGIVAPKGESMNMGLELELDGHRAMEIELYRRIIPPEHATVGGTL
jgi:hypothetical protein